MNPHLAFLVPTSCKRDRKLLDAKQTPPAPVWLNVVVNIPRGLEWGRRMNAELVQLVPSVEHLFPLPRTHFSGLNGAVAQWRGLVPQC